jgi:hypothetical protein
MNNVKVMKTVYPPDRIGENEWMKEFNIGKRLLNPINDVGMTFGEFLDHLKKNYSSQKQHMPILFGKNI